MSNKCCSGNSQGEINIDGGSIKQRIKQNVDSCYVVRIPANQEVYIVTGDKVSGKGRDTSSSTSSSTSITDDDSIMIEDDSSTKTNLIIAVVILALLLALFIGLTIYFGFIRKTK
jgi:hypothetical protein